MKVVLGVLAVLVLAAPVTLRYRFVVGQVRRFQITEHSETTIRVDGATDSTRIKQDTTATLEARVVSVSGKNGKVEERRFDEHRTIDSPSGKSESVAPPSTRLVTYSPIGKVLKIERKPIQGVADERSSFLDGLAVQVSDGPVKPGDTWAGVVSAVGPDDRPMPVRFASRFLGMTKRVGHPCAQIVTTLSAEFAATLKGQNSPSDGSLHGTVTNYLARDLGQDVEVATELVLSLDGPVSLGGQTGDGTTVIVSRSRMTLEN